MKETLGTLWHESTSKLRRWNYNKRSKLRRRGMNLLNKKRDVKVAERVILTDRSIFVENVLERAVWVSRLGQRFRAVEREVKAAERHEKESRIRLGLVGAIHSYVYTKRTIERLLKLLEWIEAQRQELVRTRSAIDSGVDQNRQSDDQGGTSVPNKDDSSKTSLDGKGSSTEPSDPFSGLKAATQTCTWTQDGQFAKPATSTNDMDVAPTDLQTLLGHKGKDPYQVSKARARFLIRTAAAAEQGYDGPPSRRTRWQ